MRRFFLSILFLVISALGKFFFAAIFRPEKFRQRTEKVSASIRIFLPEIGDGLIRSSVTLKRLKQIRTLNSSDPNSSFLSVCSDLRPSLRKTPAEATVLNFSLGFKIESLPVFEPQPPFRLDLENLVSKSSNLQLFLLLWCNNNNKKVVFVSPGQKNPTKVCRRRCCRRRTSCQLRPPCCSKFWCPELARDGPRWARGRGVRQDHPHALDHCYQVTKFFPLCSNGFLKSWPRLTTRMITNSL